MGVDYTAFVAYGVPLSVPDGFDSDHAEEILQAGMHIVDFGSLAYGGTGGYLLICGDTHRSAAAFEVALADTSGNPSVMDGALDKALMRLSRSKIERLRAKADGIYGWYVAGRVW